MLIRSPDYITAHLHLSSSRPPGVAKEPRSRRTGMGFIEFVCVDIRYGRSTFDTSNYIQLQGTVRPSFALCMASSTTRIPSLDNRGSITGGLFPRMAATRSV